MMAWATLGLAGLPVIVHLINRRRYREEPWAAMALLTAAHQRSRRRIQLEHILLLVVRTAAIVLLGLVVARPYARAAYTAGGLAGGTRHDRVIIIDSSLSMNALRDDGASAFESARELAIELTNHAGPLDRTAVVTAGGPARVRTQLVHDRDAVRAMIASQECGVMSTDLPGAIASANEMLASGDALPGARLVYVLTDLSEPSIPASGERGATQPADARDAPETSEVSGRPDTKAIDAIYFLDAGPARRPNLTVQRLAIRSPLVGTGMPISATASIINSGDVAMPSAGLSVLVDGIATLSLDCPSLASGQTYDADFEFTVDRGGVHRLAVSQSSRGGRGPSRSGAGSSADVLAEDDVRFLTFDIVKDLSVLAVQETQSGAGEAALFYVLAALMSRQEASSGAAHSATIISPVELEQQVLEDYAIILLGDVRGLSAKTWRRLSEYVEAGGALAAYLGPSIDKNNFAGSDAEALFGCRLLSALTRAEETSGRRLSISELTHPIVTDLAGRDRGGLSSTRVEGYWRLEPIPAASPQPEIALQFDNGDPAIVVRRAGRGRAALIATTADMTWNNLPSKPDFVPLTLNLVTYLVGDPAASRNVEAGAALVHPIRPPSPGMTCRLILPDGRDTTLHGVLQDREPVWRFEDTQKPGVYTFESADATSYGIVNVNAADAVLRRVDPARLKRVFGSKAEVIAPEQILRELPTAAPAREYTSGLMWALFAAIVSESAVASWCGHRR